MIDLRVDQLASPDSWLIIRLGVIVPGVSTPKMLRISVLSIKKKAMESVSVSVDQEFILYLRLTSREHDNYSFRCCCSGHSALSESRAVLSIAWFMGRRHKQSREVTSTNLKQHHFKSVGQLFTTRNQQTYPLTVYSYRKSSITTLKNIGSSNIEVNDGTIVRG